jgi:hypothetical protein
VGTSGGPSRGVPLVLLASPPLLTVRDVLASTSMTTTIVPQGAAAGTSMASGTSGAGGGDDIDWEDI